METSIKFILVVLSFATCLAFGQINTKQIVGKWELLCLFDEEIDTLLYLDYRAYYTFTDDGLVYEKDSVAYLPYPYSITKEYLVMDRSSVGSVDKYSIVALDHRRLVVRPLYSQYPCTLTFIKLE